MRKILSGWYEETISGRVYKIELDERGEWELFCEGEWMETFASKGAAVHFMREYAAKYPNGC